MLKLFQNLYHDEAGFIVSAELILISTIVVLGSVVGLSEVSHSINQELEDVGSALGSVNQSLGSPATAEPRAKSSAAGSSTLRMNAMANSTSTATAAETMNPAAIMVWNH